MLATLAITAIPVYAFQNPPNPEDSKYELYGPHVKGIICTIYTSEETEWAAMDANALDLEDWPLTKPWIDKWTGDPRFTIGNYGGEAGYFILDINHNATYGGKPNPGRVLEFREAIAAMVNRTYITQTIMLGQGIPMYTVIPSYMAGYVNHDIAPGGSLEALTYGGAQGNLTLASLYLNASGEFPYGPDGWRYWDINHNGVKDTGEDLAPIFYARSDDPTRLEIGNDLANKFADPLIKIHMESGTNYLPSPRSVTSGAVMGQKNFVLYTGGWTGIGPDPDWVWDLYNSENYWHPGKPPNYDKIGSDDATLDALDAAVKFATDYPTGTQKTLDFQVEFAENAAAVPLFCTSGVKAYRNHPVEAPSETWIDLVNQKAVGWNSWWSTLDMMMQTNFYPNAYVHYGFKSDVELLNPLYAEWYWDWEVLGRIYDGGAGRDPYTLATFKPQLFKQWAVGTWKDASGNTLSKVTITLRPDMYWQDGHPITIADVYYTLVTASKDLIAAGQAPPWWYPTVQSMSSVSIIDDYNIEVLLNVQSVWAVGWVIGNIIIPKHIWEPLIKTGDPTKDMADPNLIGSGPFRFRSHSSGVSVQLDANTPGSVENSIVSPGYWQYCPIHVNVQPDNYLFKVNISPSATTVVSNVTIQLKNFWVNDTYQGTPGSGTGTLIVNKYVYLNGVLQPGFPHDVSLPTVSPYPEGSSDTETLHLTLNKKTLNWVKVAVHIKGPAMLDDVHPNPWISQWINVTVPIWVTIKTDVSGTTLYDVLGYGTYPAWLKSEAPAPDLKVDGKDVTAGSLAFGTVPGDARWSTVADVNKDYKVDGKDIGIIALNFGY